MKAAIQLNHVSKLFSRDEGRAPLIGIMRNMFSSKRACDYHHALRDLSLTIEKGDRVGLIGGNGAGKTTLMKLIAGLHPPTSGSIEVEGRISFLAGLGIGMLDELTVVENASLYAAIYGVERRTFEANLDEIVSWAGLEDFQHTLFKHLSAGMKVRLAFSTYRYFEGDIFLMDEALSAGDQNFRKKCHQVLFDQRDTNRTMVIASHNTQFIEEFCNKTLWIEHGQLNAYGATDEIVQRYRASASPGGRPTGECQQSTDGY
jgi:ABC-type polysaccharide/polyol phosphate transport system ATPase subunit